MYYFLMGSNPLKERVNSPPGSKMNPKRRGGTDNNITLFTPPRVRISLRHRISPRCYRVRLTLTNLGALRSIQSWVVYLSSIPVTIA